MRFPISQFRHKQDSLPKGIELDLVDFEEIFAEPLIRGSKDGPLWSPASYAAGAKRGAAWVQGVCALVLDFDDGVEPDELEPHWEELHYFVHSTFSNWQEKDEEPACCRWRAVFPLAAPVSADLWKVKFEPMFLQLGRGRADPSCKDASRMYYLPACPAGRRDQAFCRVHRGELLDPGTFEALRPLEGRPVVDGKGERPGDRYNRDTSWAEILTPHGWSFKCMKGQQQLWTRPGKDARSGPSAITGTCPEGTRYLKVFTSNGAPLKCDKTYTPFGVYAALCHGGIFADATRALGGSHGGSAAVVAVSLGSGLSGDDEETVERLAAMNAFDRDRVLPEEAKRLEVLLSTLRKAVNDRVGGAAADREQGMRLEFITPDPWPEAVEGAQLLDEISRTLRRYLVLPKYAAEILALWAVHTHCYDLFDWSPKIGLLSPEKRCGKSRTFDCLEQLVCKPLYVGGLTAPVLFRSIAIGKPTLLMDEADTYFRENEGLRGVLNSSSKKGGKVIRCEGDDNEPHMFDVFTPIAYAMIGEPPGTVGDRSIFVRMKRKTKGDSVESLRRKTAEQVLAPLARKAARFVLDCREILASSSPLVPSGLNDREADIWEPLLAIADAAGGKWPGIARDAAVHGADSDGVENESAGIRLLADVREIFAKVGRDRLTSQDLCARLAQLEEGPWAAWGRASKPISPPQVAKLLRDYDIRPGSIRLEEGGTPKGYMLSAFEDSFARYLPGIIAATPPLDPFADEGDLP